MFSVLISQILFAILICTIRMASHGGKALSKMESNIPMSLHNHESAQPPVVETSKTSTQNYELSSTILRHDDRKKQRVLEQEEIRQN